MPLTVSGLVLAEVGRAEQMRPQACQHQSLEDLGDGREVGTWRSACSSLAENCRARPSSAVEAPAPSCIGQETLQSAMTGWRVWRWLTRGHERMSWFVDTAIHRAVDDLGGMVDSSFRTSSMVTGSGQGADGLQTCDDLTTAECSTCCRGCVWPCRQRTGRTSIRAERTDRRRTLPSVCCAAAFVLFARWHECHRMLRRVVPWCDRIVTCWCFSVQPNKLIDRPICLERLRAQFFTIFHKTLRTAWKCAQLDACCCWDKPEVDYRF